MEFILALFVAIVVALAGLFLFLKFSRVHLDGASRSFYSSVRQWELHAGVNNRYQLPWFLMLGSDHDNECLLKSWGLTASDSNNAWFGRWWYGAEGAVLAVPGALFMHTDASSVQARLWRRLLRLILKLRANRPIDGIIWNCSSEQLMNAELASLHGVGARRKFIEIQQYLGLNMPVYLILSGMEAVAGFTELMARLPAKAGSHPLGWTSPYTVLTSWHSEWIDQAIGQTSQAITGAIMEIGALKGNIPGELYGLPQRLAQCHDALLSLCDPVFQGVASGEAPRLRGIYLTARTVSHIPRDPDGLYTDESRSASSVSLVFASQLWRQRIAAEQGLAQPIMRVLRLRQRWHQFTAITATILGVTWLLSMLWVWHTRVQEAHLLANLLDETRTKNTAQMQTNAQRVTALWQLLAGAPRWSFKSTVLPVSWFSPTDYELSQSVRDRIQTHLAEPIQQEIQRELQELSGVRASNFPLAKSFDENAYLQHANLIAEKALFLQMVNARFEQALQPGQRPLNELAGLGNTLFGLDLQPRTLVYVDLYNQLADTSINPLASSISLESAKGSVSAEYQKNMRLWLDQFMGAERFSTAAGYLSSHLQALQYGQRNSLPELEELNDRIDQLRHAVDQTNAAWKERSGSELTPEYQASLDRARQSVLIGPEVVLQVQRYAETLRRTFHDRWLMQDSTQTGILRQQSSGLLELQSVLIKLDQSIEALLQQNFSYAALSESSKGSSVHTLPNLDEKAVEAALEFHASYLAYLQKDIAELPAPFRKALIEAAQSATRAAMWYRLSDTPSNPLETHQLTTRTAFDLSTDKAAQLLMAFNELNDRVHADALKKELNRRALVDLYRTADEIQHLPVFAQVLEFGHWDGRSNFALTSYREGSQQGLKQTLNLQFNLISDYLSRIRPALDWLNAQREALSASELQKLNSFFDMAVEFKKYSEQNPTSSPMLFEQLVNRDFNSMDTTNCMTVLTAASLPTDQGALASLARALRDQAQMRCTSLQQQTAEKAWQRITSYFSHYLAGRFPFTFDEFAADANPDRVRDFLLLIDTDGPAALAGLKDNYSPDTSAARDFLQNLQRARLWLGPVLLADKQGTQGVDIEVRWRTDRQEERGADQIIDWDLSSGVRHVRYPGELKGRLTWRLDDPVKLILRWATGSTQRPAEDPRQPGLAVYDREAGWGYEGSWALIRFMRANHAYERFPSDDTGDRPLAFQLPVRSPIPGESSALVFLRVSLMPVGGKEALSITALPVSAPKSPFQNSNTLPLADLQVLP
ncbi:type VI secretion system protein [Pseudomonas sp. JZ134]|uniref:type VI secretion system protein n=1 Tax=Pseudomonas sp. JZ134 TaxID=2806615 RepID=UPI003DA0C601